MTKHFHGIRKIKGGFDIDENTIPDDSDYWMIGCDRLLSQLTEALDGDYEKAKKAIGSAWSEEYTWKEIYKAVAPIAALAQAQKIKRQTDTDMARRIEMASEGSDNSVSGQWREHGYY